jgi:ATPase subunit of ABC transporter with duplicated ATPase domains
VNYLTLDNITKTYGEKVLFSGISLQISKGQKVALVAKNGTGKTTLLRVIAGQEAPEGENATVLIHRDVRVGYLSQDPEFYEQSSVLDAIFDADTELTAHTNRITAGMGTSPRLGNTLLTLVRACSMVAAISAARPT